MTWYDASIAVPAMNDEVEIILETKNGEKAIKGCFRHENWISKGEFIFYELVLRWRPIAI